MRQKITQSGSVLVAIILMFPFLILIVAYYTELTINGFGLAKKDQSHTYAQLATDAGIDLAMEEINEDDSWVGTGGEVNLQNDSKVRTTYQLTVTGVDDTHKTLLSVGRAYRPASSTTPEATVNVTVQLRGIGSGNYSIVSGVGGLVMSNIIIGAAVLLVVVLAYQIGMT